MSEPRGAAPAAASLEPAAEAEANPDVFLSYSRKDRGFVLRLRSALEEAGWGVWVDEDDIPPAAEWRDELAAGIRTAHTFVFVLSPDSAASDYCRWELAQAVSLGKRLIPLVIRPVEQPPEELAARQYVFMREQDDFDQSFTTLDTAIQTDLEWVREHRLWLLAALRWAAQDRDRSLLLRGRDLKAAEAWLARQGERTEPRPTQVQTEFLLASRAWETRRVRIIAGGVIVALAISSALGVVALLQRNDARNQAAIARSRELALASTSQLSIDPERSLLLATAAVDAARTAEADGALRRAVFSSRVRVAVPLEAGQIGGLINAVAFSPDGKYVAAALNNGTVSVVSSTARPGARATVLPPAPRRPDDPCSTFASAAGNVAVTFSPNSRFVSAVDEIGWIQVWRWPTPARPVTSPFCLGRTTPPDTSDVFSGLVDEPRRPGALAFVANDTVAVAEPDGRVLRWRWQTRRRPALRGRVRRAVLAAAFSEATRETTIADEAGIDLLGPTALPVGRLPARGVYALAASADGRIVAGANGSTLVVWRSRRAAPQVVLHTPGTIRAVAISRDGAFVAAGDVRRAVRVWNLSRGGPAVVLAGSQGPVRALAFSRDGHRLVSGGDDGVVRVWDWDASRPPSLPGAARRASRFQLTAENRLFAIDPKDAHAGWIDVGVRLRRLESVLQPADLSVSEDGRRAVAPARHVLSHAVQLWDLGRSLRPHTAPVEGSVNAVALSPDGRWIVFGGRGLRVAPWPGSVGRALGPAPGLSQYSAAVFDPDSRRLAASAFDGKNTTVSVWTLPSASSDWLHGSAAAARRFAARGFSTDLAFSHDGKRLVASQTDGGVYVWDVDGHQAPIVLRGHPDGVNSAAFSPGNSDVVVSGGADGTVRVWRLDEGAQSVAIAGAEGPIGAVAFTPDGSGVTVVGSRGARVWSCDFCGSTSDVVAVARRHTTRALTPDERALFLHDD